MMMRQRRAAILTALLFLSGILSACEYGRMRDQESVRTYEKAEPDMDTRAIPVSGGFNALVAADPVSLKNPVPVNANSVEKGRQAYGYFCTQCHGPKGDGNATVGQSFSPLPSDLRSPEIQAQEDGRLFQKILLGAGRHPRLYNTVSEEDTWAVVNYIRSLKKG
jgi:mono/diheme cytochrome c family protein